MASSDEIAVLHSQWVERIRNVTGHSVRFRNLTESWEHVAVARNVAFDVVLAPYAVYAERKRGGRCPVFPLRCAPANSDDDAWAGWYETWVCQKRQHFDLIGAGWTFFWGMEHRLGRDQQVIRAEWDQAEHRGRLVAQPHWHVDTDIMVGYSTRHPSVPSVPREGAVLQELPAGLERQALEEISPNGVQELDLSAIHLGMGGWLNDVGHPTCWQRHVRGACVELLDWSERTLLLAIDQFREVRVRAIAE